MKIKMRHGLAGHPGYAHSAVYDVEDAEAERLIAAEFADAHEDNDEAPEDRAGRHESREG